MAKVTSQSSKSFGLLAGLFVLLAATQGAHANLLSNPGFESDPDNQTTNVVAWNLYGPNVSNQTSTSTAHSGTNYFKVFNAMIGSQSYIPLMAGSTPQPAISSVARILLGSK